MLNKCGESRKIDSRVDKIDSFCGAQTGIHLSPEHGRTTNVASACGEQPLAGDKNDRLLTQESRFLTPHEPISVVDSGFSVGQ